MTSLVKKNITLKKKKKEKQLHDDVLEHKIF